MGRNGRMLRRGAIALAVAGLLAGGVTQTATAAPPKSTITIGVPVAQTGSSAASLKYVKPVAEAWGKWVNANGGINGHPVKLAISDVGPDAVKSVAAVKDLVETQKVLALVSVGDPNDTAWEKYVTKQKIAVVGGGFGNPFWFTNPNFFGTNPSPVMLNSNVPLLAKRLGVRKLGLVVCAEVAACVAADPPMRAATAQSGLRFGGTFKIAASQPNYTAECLAVKNQEIQFVQIAASTTPTFRFIQDCERQGVDVRYGVGAGAWNEGITEFDAGRIVTMTGGFPWYVEHPLVRQFRSVMKQYAGKNPWKGSTGTLTWQGLELFRKAMANASATPVRADVFSAMYKLKDENLGGLLPQKMNWKTGKPSPQVNCGFLGETVHAVFTNPLGGLTPFCPGT